ncbi:MAG: hypothetical protein RR284_04220 [Ruthenibacterium sp.]
MKKFISIMMVAALACALSISSFAATQTKADLLALVGKAPAEYQAQAISTINEMTEAQAAAVDVPAVKAEMRTLQKKANDLTLTVADVAAAQAVMQKATGVAIAVDNVSISGGKIYATVTTAVNGKAAVGAYNAPISNNPGPVPAPTPAPAPGKGGSGTSNGVIKTTGVDVSGSALLLVIAMAGVLGVATIKTHKAYAEV